MNVVAHMRNALAFAEMLPADLPEPEVCTDNDGEFCFDWYFGRHRVVSATVRPSGSVSWASFIGEERASASEPLTVARESVANLVMRAQEHTGSVA